MSVPLPGPINQNESVACVAEPFLQQAARRSRYAVVGDRRVAIVSDTGDRARLFGLGISQGGVKMIEILRGIVDQAGRAGISRVTRAGFARTRWLAPNAPRNQGSE